MRFLQYTVLCVQFITSHYTAWITYGANIETYTYLRFLYGTKPTTLQYCSVNNYSSFEFCYFNVISRFNFKGGY